MSALSDLLHERRLELGLSQVEAGARIGVSSTSYDRWEKGAHPPKAKYVPVVAEFLDMEPREVARTILYQPSA